MGCSGCSYSGGLEQAAYAAPAPQYGASSHSYSSNSAPKIYAAALPMAMYASKPKAKESKVVLQDNPHQYKSSVFNYASDLAKYLAISPAYQPIHVADNFLNPRRPQTQFIDDASSIQRYVEEAFEKTTGNKLPENIMISVVDKEELKQIHERNGGKWSDNIQGFSLNGYPIKYVFVKNNDLDRVMLVLGHEIGHVLSPPIKDKATEEAKAFAFEFAWMKTIVEENIANLADNINLNFEPANNGLHDVAWNFVRKAAKLGKTAMEIYTEIVTGLLEVEPSLYTE